MATDIEITDTGVIIPDTQEVYDEVAADWNTALGGNMQTDPSTPQGQLITSEVAEIDNKNNRLAEIINQINPKTNNGIWQDAIGYIFFLLRKEDESSVVTCQCVGLNGTLIEAGKTIKSTNGDLFQLTDSVTIGVSGTIDGNFASIEKGLIPVESNTMTTIVDVVPGWDSVDNSSAGAIGRETESRQEFEARRALSVAKNSKGTVSSIYARVYEVDDVLDIFVKQNRKQASEVIDGITITGNSVYTCVLGGDTQEIANAIEIALSAGCDTVGDTSATVDVGNGATELINFQRPTADGVKIEVALADISTTPVGVENLIKDIVFDNFYGLTPLTERVRIGSTVYASRFYTGVAAIDGVSIISIEIAYLSDAFGDSIYVPVDTYATLDKDDITVTIV